jgi:hypothetical protein
VQGSSQFRLLAERRFGPFLGVQFLGAFNGNVFKQAFAAARPSAEALQQRVLEMRGDWR